MNIKPSKLFLTRVNALTQAACFARSSLVAASSCDSQGCRKSLCKDETTKHGLWDRRNGGKI